MELPRIEESLEANCSSLVGAFIMEVNKVICDYDEKRNAKPSKISLGVILGKPIL
ncbi:hypothetical protein Hanom_Chr11g01055931 [Helianthus anomalus]